MSPKDTDPVVVYNSEDSEKEAMEEKVKQRDRWRDKVIERCNRYGEKSINIMILGMPGVGKSSFFTNIPAALSGEWHEVALVGHHGGKDRPITLFVQKLQKCALSDEMVYGEKFKDMHLPNFIDLTGLANENTIILQETIRAFNYGRIPNHEPILSVLALGQEKGVKAIQDKYDERDEHMVIHRVIVLAAANEPIPEQLCECIMSACRPTGKDVFKYKRAIPIFGVMTKADKIESMSEDDKRAYEVREEKFKQLLGIPEVRFAKFRNYCDDTVPNRLEETDSDIDIATLKFFHALVNPTYKPDNPDDNPYKEKKEEKIAEENAENIKQEEQEAAARGNAVNDGNNGNRQAVPPDGQQGRRWRWYEWVIIVVYILSALLFVSAKTKDMGVSYLVSYLMLMVLPLLIFFHYKGND